MYIAKAAVRWEEYALPPTDPFVVYDFADGTVTTIKPLNLSKSQQIHLNLINILVHLVFTYKIKLPDQIFVHF